MNYKITKNWHKCKYHLYDEALQWNYTWGTLTLKVELSCHDHFHINAYLSKEWPVCKFTIQI